MDRGPGFEAFPAGRRSAVSPDASSVFGSDPAFPRSPTKGLQEPNPVKRNRFEARQRLYVIVIVRG